MSIRTDGPDKPTRTSSTTPAPAPKKASKKQPVPVGQSTTTGTTTSTTTSNTSSTNTTGKKDPWGDVKKVYKEKGFWAAAKKIWYDTFQNPEYKEQRDMVEAQGSYLFDRPIY